MATQRAHASEASPEQRHSVKPGCDASLAELDQQLRMPIPLPGAKNGDSLAPTEVAARLST